jgi:hypothetical protein
MERPSKRLGYPLPCYLGVRLRRWAVVNRQPHAVAAIRFRSLTLGNAIAPHYQPLAIPQNDDPPRKLRLHQLIEHPRNFNTILLRQHLLHTDAAFAH